MNPLRRILAIAARTQKPLSELFHPPQSRRLKTTLKSITATTFQLEEIIAGMKDIVGKATTEEQSRQCTALISPLQDALATITAFNGRIHAEDKTYGLAGDHGTSHQVESWYITVQAFVNMAEEYDSAAYPLLTRITQAKTQAEQATLEDDIRAIAPLPPPETPPIQFRLSPDNETLATAQAVI